MHVCVCHRLTRASQRSGGVVRVACTGGTSMKRMHASRCGHDCSTHSYRRTHAYMHACIPTYIHAYIRACMHVCIHTSKHTKRTGAPVSDILQTPVCPDLCSWCRYNLHAHMYTRHTYAYTVPCRLQSCTHLLRSVQSSLSGAIRSLKHPERQLRFSSILIYVVYSRVCRVTGVASDSRV